MYYFDNRKHHKPHIHVQYGDDEAVVAISEGDVLEGSLPRPKMKLVQAWLGIHQDALMTNWKLAVRGEQVFKIDPLKEDFTLLLSFSDGEKKIFNVSPYLNKGVFKELTDFNYSRRVKPFFGGVGWPHEQDFSADTLYLESKPVPNRIAT